MKIRSITSFYDPGAADAGETLDLLSRFAKTAEKRFGDAGIETQSRRLATTPFAEMCPSGCRESGVQLAQKLEVKAQERGFKYLSMGPALPENPESFSLVPELLAETKNVFFSANLIRNDGKISPAAINAAAGIIHRTATIEKDGFANLRFAALAGVRPFTPFFPAAFGEGSEPAFSIAVECADDFVIAFREAGSFDAAREKSLKTLEGAASRMAEINRTLEKGFPGCFQRFRFLSCAIPGGDKFHRVRIGITGYPVTGAEWFRCRGSIFGRYPRRRYLAKSGFQWLDAACFGRFRIGRTHGGWQPGDQGSAALLLPVRDRAGYGPPGGGYHPGADRRGALGRGWDFHAVIQTAHRTVDADPGQKGWRRGPLRLRIFCLGPGDAAARSGNEKVLRGGRTSRNLSQKNTLKSQRTCL